MNTVIRFRLVWNFECIEFGALFYYLNHVWSRNFWIPYDTCYLQYWSIGKIIGFAMHYWCIIYLHPNVLYWTFCRGHNSILFSFSISLFSPVLYYFLSYPYLSAVIPDIMLTICMLFLCSSTEFALFLCLSKVYFIICSPFKTESHD